MIKKIHKYLTIAIVIIILFLLLPNKSVPESIIAEPSDILHTRSKEIEMFDESTKKLGNKLTGTIESLDHPFSFLGLGLAAPQIGENKRIISIRTDRHKYTIMINPVITQKKWLLPWTEKCFSLEGRHLLKRYMWVQVQYQDINGNKHETTLIGPTAAILQQEIDHLDGILINER